MHTRRWDHQAIKLRNKRRHQVQELYGSRPTGFQRTRGCAGPCLSRSRVCVCRSCLSGPCVSRTGLSWLWSWKRILSWCSRMVRRCNAFSFRLQEAGSTYRLPKQAQRHDAANGQLWWKNVCLDPVYLEPVWLDPVYLDLLCVPGSCLSGPCLSGSWLSGPWLSGSCLSGCWLSGSCLFGPCFSGSCLPASVPFFSTYDCVYIYIYTYVYTYIYIYITILLFFMFFMCFMFLSSISLLFYVFIGSKVSRMDCL